MKHIKPIILSFLLVTLLGCNYDTYYIDPTHSAIKELYNGKVSVSKYIVKGINQEDKTQLKIRVTESPIIGKEGYDVNYASSLIPLIAYLNLSEAGLKEMTHIKTILDVTKEGKTVQVSSEYSLETLSKVSKCFENVAGFIENEEKGVDEAIQYIDTNYIAKNDIESLLSSLQNAAKESGGLVRSEIVGYDLDETEDNRKLVRFHNSRNYAQAYLTLYIIYELGEGENKILGFSVK